MDEAFKGTVESALMEVADMVPRKEGLFVGGKKMEVYVAGQCMPTIGRKACGRCLQLAVRSVEGCMLAGSGRAVHYGCFLRFSGRPFFNENLAMDLDLAAQPGFNLDGNLEPIT